MAPRANARDAAKNTMECAERNWIALLVIHVRRKKSPAIANY